MVSEFNLFSNFPRFFSINSVKEIAYLRSLFKSFLFTKIAAPAAPAPAAIFETTDNPANSCPTCPSSIHACAPFPFKALVRAFLKESNIFLICSPSALRFSNNFNLALSSPSSSSTAPNNLFLIERISFIMASMIRLIGPR